jgi:hypothetical protein
VRAERAQAHHERVDLDNHAAEGAGEVDGAVAVLLLDEREPESLIERKRLREIARSEDHEAQGGLVHQDSY